MTERLYFRDSSLLEFEGTIVESTVTDGLYGTVLDSTAFYPTSGGQMHDTGQLNGVRITDVVEDDLGRVRHISETVVGEIGQIVAGAVDSQRRRRHRQQHTAQHILSQVFVRLYGNETVSVHLGEEYGAVELDTDTLSAEQTRRVEESSNEAIWDNRAVDILFVAGEELAGLPLRRVPKRQGECRIVRIHDFDWSACGGTHCSSTAEVGFIKIMGVEKLRGHALVRFLSGVQAFEDYRTRYKVTSELSQSLTCHVGDLTRKVGRLVADSKLVRRELVELYKEVLPLRAESIAQKAQKGDVICEELVIPDKRLAGQLAEMVADRVQGVALFFHEGRLLLAVPRDGALDAGKLVRRLAVLSGLKGGGGKRLAQLGGAERLRLSDYKGMVFRLLNEE